MDAEHLTKLRAIKALPGAGMLYFGFREHCDPPTWYIANTYIHFGSWSGLPVVTSPHEGAASPEGAIDEWWEQCVTNLPDDHYLLTSLSDRSHAYRWDQHTGSWMAISRDNPPARVKP